MFFIINSYTTGFSPTVLSNILKLTLGIKYDGEITTDLQLLRVKVVLDKALLILQVSIIEARLLVELIIGRIHERIIYGDDDLIVVVIVMVNDKLILQIEDDHVQHDGMYQVHMNGLHWINIGIFINRLGQVQQLLVRIGIHLERN